MQQHQLRLNLYIEAARSLKQTHQHHTQRNFFQWAVKVRLAHRTYCSFQLIDARLRRHPATFNVQLRHTLVVTAEKRGEVLRKVLFVHLGQGADDAKVQRDVAAKGFRIEADLDIARVHIGMEKTIAKHLGEENRHTIARQFGNIHASIAQLLHLADGHAVHTLHHHHFGVAKVPKYLGHQHQIQPLHVAPQLGRIGGFAHQIQFVVQIGIELGHHFARFQALAISREAFQPTGHHAHESQVFFNHRQHPGTQHLHRHLMRLPLTVHQGSEVHLCNRGAGHRLTLERGEYLGNRFAKCPLDGGNRRCRIERWHAVLQQGQFIGNVRRHQIAPGGQHLAELHENRPQPLQGLAQTLTTRSAQIAPDRHQPR